VRWFIGVAFQNAVIDIAAALPICPDAHQTVALVLWDVIQASAGHQGGGGRVCRCGWLFGQAAASRLLRVAGSVRLPTSSGEKLALKRHHRLFTHPSYNYPDFNLPGGAGVAVLRTARAAADRPFRRSRR
jgi:hypothetical protein